MDFGFSLPPRGPMATPENIATLARQGSPPILTAKALARFGLNYQTAHPCSISGQTENGLT